MEIRIKQSIVKSLSEKLFKFNLLEMNRNRPEININAEYDYLVTMWLCLAGICHNTRGLYGRIQGNLYKGWDYLSLRFTILLMENPMFFEPGNLVLVTGTELAEALKDDKGVFRIRDIDRRAELLADIGYRLMRDYDSKASLILEGSGGYMIRDNGLGVYQQLEKFEAFRDPERKKSTVFIMLPYEAGRFEIKDPENLEPIVDYHMMRGLLRNGAIDIDDATFRLLTSGKKVDTMIESEIRKKAKIIVKNFVETTGKSVFNLNWIMWNLYRSCCRMDKPACDTCKIFNDKNDYCSFATVVDYPCTGQCPLSDICLAATDKERRKLKEPVIDTEYY